MPGNGVVIVFVPVAASPEAEMVKNDMWLAKFAYAQMPNFAGISARQLSHKLVAGAATGLPTDGRWPCVSRARVLAAKKLKGNCTPEPAKHGSGQSKGVALA